MLINQLIEGVVSAKRVKAFLDGDELQPDAREVTLSPSLCTGDVVCYPEGRNGDVLGNGVSGIRNRGR